MLDMIHQVQKWTLIDKNHQSNYSISNFAF